MATLAFCVLGSGSGGNCTAIVLDPDGPGPLAPRVILVDIGLSPKATRKRLGLVGLRFADVTDILLTHLDSDHLHPSWPTALFHNEQVHVHVHARHEGGLRATGINEARVCAVEEAAPRERSHGGAETRSRAEDGETLPLFAEVPRDDAFVGTTPARGGHVSRFPLTPGFAGPSPASGRGEDSVTRFGAVPLPHDELGATAYVLEHGGVRFGLATDLGHVPQGLLDAFTGLDAVAFESNYDPQMQRASPRPEFLKRRIMGGHGHLSNEEALEAVVEIDRRGTLQHVALLHLSRQCNDPGLVRRLYAERAPQVLPRLVLSRQDVPTGMLRIGCRG